MQKLGMLGNPNDPVDKVIKIKLLKRFWNEKEPENIYKTLKTLIRKENASKESVQDLLKFFKMRGLFKRTLPTQGMEKMWRTILKEQRLQGFLLEN